MEKLSKETLKALLDANRWPCISIFFDTQRIPLQEKLDPVKLNNLLRKAEQQLIQSGVKTAEARDVLQPAWALLDPMNHAFWQHLGSGLAIFCSRGFFRYFRLPCKLKQTLVMSDHFHLKPLLPLFSANSLFYLLALGLGGVVLYHGTAGNISPVDLASLPDSLANPLAKNGIAESFGGQSPVSPAALGREPLILSQERTPSDEARNKILTYFQQIRSGIHEFFGSQRVSLVLAGDNYLNSLYRQVNDYPHLLDRDVVGDQSEVTEDELHRRAWAVVGPSFEEARRFAAARYTQFINSGKTSRDITEIVPAAYYKRIDVLFAPAALERPGTFDPGTGKVKLEEKTGPGIIDLVDFATAHTFLNGGTAYVLPPEGIPEGAPAAALFRY